MVANGQVQTLSDERLRSFDALFSTLGVPDAAGLTGVHRAEFVGPAWLRKGAPVALVLGGLGGWWGKEFPGPTDATNLVQRRGGLLRVLPMKLLVAPSLLDGQLRGRSRRYAACVDCLPESNQRPSESSVLMSRKLNEP
jgi:hypothetical protein